MLQIMGIVRDMLMANSSFFLHHGSRLFDSLAIIMLIWFFALSAIDGQISESRFFRLLVTMLFAWTMLKFYASPLPGLDRSFPQMVVDEGQTLALHLDTGISNQLSLRLNRLLKTIPGPSAPTIAGIAFGDDALQYLALRGLIAVAKLFLLMVIALGYISSAVCALVGPCFIPFMIVPPLERLFWNWLSAFMQFAFYPVIALAYLYVLGNMLINFLDLYKGPINATTLAGVALALIFILLAFIYGMSKVPSLVNSFFSGANGQ